MLLVGPHLVNITIDRDSPVPLYHQLAEQLSASIADGRLQPGDPFENEVALAERLGLSRPTVRRAIQEMVDQGLLVRRRGLGTRVANRKVHRKAELTSLFDDLRRAGRDPRTTILTHEVVTDERAAAALDLEPDATMARGRSRTHAQRSSRIGRPRTGSDLGHRLRYRSSAAAADPFGADRIRDRA